MTDSAAFLVDKKSSSQIGKAILDVINSNDKLTTLSINSLNNVKSFYWKNVTPKFEKLFSNVIKCKENKQYE